VEHAAETVNSLNSVPTFELLQGEGRQNVHRLAVPAGRAAPLEPPSLAVSRHDVLGGLIHEYRSVAA
jgi:hypothetical protein